jgi:hypothetical protein
LDELKILPYGDPPTHRHSSCNKPQIISPTLGVNQILAAKFGNNKRQMTSVTSYQRTTAVTNRSPRKQMNPANRTQGRAIAQAVCRWLTTAATRFETRF